MRATPGRLACAVGAAALAGWVVVLAPSFFRTDDFSYLGEILVRRPSLLSWLDSVYYEHWAPGHRLAFWVMDGATEASWWGVVLFEVALLGLALAAYWHALVLLFGRSWWLLVPVSALALCSRLALAFLWPSAGLQLLPTLAGGTVALAALLRYVRTRRLEWALLAAGAIAAALLFYERALLFGPLILALRILLLCPDLRPRAVVREVWPERAGWGLVAAVCVLYLAHYVTLQTGAVKSVGAADVAEMAGVLWLRNVGTGVLGAGTGPDLLPIVAGQLLIVAALVAGLRAKGADALRGWAFVALAVGATLALIAAGRLSVLGPEIGLDPRYAADLFWLVPLGVLAALHPRRVQQLGAPWPQTERSHRWAAPAAAVAAAALAVSSLSTILDERAAWQGREAREVALRIRDEARAFERRTGAPAAVRGGLPPAPLHEARLPPYADNARVLPLLDAPVVVDPPTGITALLSAEGRIEPVRRRRRVPVTAGCITPGQPLELRPARPVTARLVTLRLELAGPLPAGGITAVPDLGRGFRPVDARTITRTAGRRTGTDLGSPEVRAVQLTAGPGAQVCLRRAALEQLG